MVYINNNISPPKKICQKIREPTPEPVVRRVFIRAPTPQPDVIERLIIKPQPRQIIEKITQQPRKPPPRIVEKVVCEPCQALIKNSCVYVDPKQNNMYNQPNHLYQPPYYQNQASHLCVSDTNISNQVCVMPKSITPLVGHPLTQTKPFVGPLPPPPPAAQPIISQPQTKIQLPQFSKLQNQSIKPTNDFINNNQNNKCFCKCCLRLKSFSTKFTSTCSSSYHNSNPPSPYCSTPSLLPCSPIPQPPPLLPQPPFIPAPISTSTRYYAYIIVPPSQTYSILALYY